MSESLAYDLDGLAVDVFELADSDLRVESLTGGHAMIGMGASACVIHRLCSGSCCCCYEQSEPEP